MKRAFQIAAAILMFVIAVWPALADVTCRMVVSASPLCCPTGMDAMSSDCPMPQRMAQTECAQNCCDHALSQPALISAIPVKPKSSAATATMMIASAGSLKPKASFLPSPTPTATASSPPRYLLNRLFRI